VTANSRAAQVLFAVIILFAGMTALGMAGLAIPLLRSPAELQRSAVPRTPQTDAPSKPVPRLAFEQLRYVGAFRVPAAESNGDSFSFGGRPIAYNPGNDSLFIGTHSGKVAEVNIPVAVRAEAIEALPAAAYMQPLIDPAEGRIKDIAAHGASLSGLLVHDHQLIGTGVIFYDAINAQSLSHFARPLKLSERAVQSLVRVGESGKTGFVAGYMASVPAEWQSRLGGPVVTGQCCLPVISRTSWGPSAFAFDPAQIRAGHNPPAGPLVYYDAEHPTLGVWMGSNETYGATTEVAGLALINGTRTALFVGRNGLGEFCYGEGTSDKSKHKVPTGGGETYCYDPAVPDKGQHGYPYRYQMWAYDLEDLAEVRAGRRDPWSVKPYAVWPFELPFPEPARKVGGVAYDAARQRLFVSQMRADRDGFALRPLIHVFHIQ
jgi:hypothetical protein